MCRWLAYSGSPILIKEALYEGPELARRSEPALAARSRADQRRRVRRRLVRRPRHAGRLPQHRTGLERQQPARARRPHQLAAVLHAYPGGDRQRRAADQLPSLPPRPLAVHAQRLHQRVRDHQTRPDTRGRPIAISRDQGPGRLRGAVLPRPHPRPRGRPAGRRRASDRSRRSVADRHDVPHPFQGTIATSDGETIWAFRYSSEKKSRSLFYTTDVPTLRQLYPERQLFERSIRQRTADRLGAARRRRRRLERGPRIHLRHRRPRPRRDATFRAAGTDDIGASECIGNPNTPY